MDVGFQRRNVKRAILIAAVLILAPCLYLSTYLAVVALYGADVIDIPGLILLHDTAFAPLMWLMGEEPPDWFTFMAYEAYKMGVEATQ